MVHIASFRTAVASGPAAAWSLEIGPLAPSPLLPAKLAFRRFNVWVSSGYRPEKHYMRGGRTPGAKSLGGR